MSQREDAKAERRRRIVAAARDLIRETGDAGLSMRAIAARANVSLTTPYSLFGSKRAIVIAVLEDVREFGERFSSLRHTDPIDPLLRTPPPSTAQHHVRPSLRRADQRPLPRLRVELQWSV